MAVYNNPEMQRIYPDIGQLEASPPTPLVESEIPPPSAPPPEYNPEIQDEQKTGALVEKKVVHLYEHTPLHSLLLLATAGLSIACLVPGARHVSALALRSVAILSSSAMCADSWNHVDVGDRILNIARIGVVTLGVIGITAAKPAVYVAALAAEVGLQALEVGKAIYEHDVVKGLTHFGVLAIDTFLLAGVVTGSWPLITTAAVLSSAAMFVFACKAANEKKEEEGIWATLDSISYLVLLGTGIATSVDVSKRVFRRPKSGVYRVTNDKDTEMNLYDAKGNYVGTLQPGEKGVFEAPIYGHDRNAIHAQTTQPSGMVEDKLIYAHKKHYTKVIHHPVKPHRIPTKPIGGTIVVDRTQTKTNKEEIHECGTITLHT